MSEPNPTAEPSAAAPLQFEQAQFVEGAAASACAACKRPLERDYFEVNGQTVCPACRDALVAAHEAGSPPGRFFGALALGCVAAAAGAGAWYAIRGITGYELSLVAIGVGWMVGLAVQRGCHGRGGWLYQTMAVFLTYASIVSTYVPPVLEGLKKAQASPAVESASAPATPGQAESATGAPAEEPLPPAPDWVLAVVAVPIAFVAPFLAGFENFLGIIIIGFGMHQAWRMTKRRTLTFSGPFRLAPAPAEAAPEPGVG